MSTRGEGAGPRRPPHSDHTGQSCPEIQERRTESYAPGDGEDARMEGVGEAVTHPPNTRHLGPAPCRWGPPAPTFPSFYSPHLSDGPPTPGSASQQGWESRAAQGHSRQRSSSWQGHNTCCGCPPRPARRGLARLEEIPCNFTSCGLSTQLLTATRARAATCLGESGSQCVHPCLHPRAGSSNKTKLPARPWKETVHTPSTPPFTATTGRMGSQIP